MENSIKDKVVAITGASSGIGEAIALLLSKKGAKVVLGARRLEQLQTLVNRIKSEGGEATFAVTDVKQREDLKSLVNLAVEQYGKLDVFINNAGISLLSPFDDLSVEEAVMFAMEQPPTVDVGDIVIRPTAQD